MSPKSGADIMKDGAVFYSSIFLLDLSPYFQDSFRTNTCLINGRT